MAETTRTPEQDSDNLNSIQYATFVDLLSEGEIEGLKDGYKSIFIENTPLQEADGKFNYGIPEDKVAEYIQLTTGANAQDAISLAAAIEDERPVNVLVSNAVPIVRTITDTNVNAVRVTVSVPALQKIRPNGDIRGSGVNVEIYVQYNGGGYTLKVKNDLSGRTSDPYQRDYIVNIDGEFPVDIKVVRASLDDYIADSNVYNRLYWDSYTEIIYNKLSYPNSALAALRLSAVQFNNIPSRSYLIRGIKVKIPSNATVDSTNGRLIYDDVWDGTFKETPEGDYDRRWTSDPAWVLWDLLTSTRYGFGDHITEAQLDKWAFFAASQYSSELVSDGLNGQEPRFSCNVNIQTQEEAYKLINDMCSVFRAMPFWSTGALTVSQDKPDDWAYLFTLANVGEQGFSYEGSSLKNRPNVVSVSYLDLDLRDIAYEVVEDDTKISQYGVVKRDISAFACTSRGQAARIGKWLLYSEQYETETVTFSTSVDAGVLVRPGQLIKIADPVKAGERRGGRIVSATTTTVTVDDATGLTTANSPQLNVILSDGTVEQRSVSGISGNVITVSTAFSSAPNANSVWLYGTTDINTTTWRVLAIEEQDGATYAVTALAYEGSKYNYVENGDPLQQRDITNLNVQTATPTGFEHTELFYEEAGAAKTKLIVSWTPVADAPDYLVRWRGENGNWSDVITRSSQIEILDTDPQTYEFKVWSRNQTRLPSKEYASFSALVEAKSAAPETPTGLSLVPNSEATAILSWDRALALDVLLGGKVLIRHSKALSGATWDAAQTVITAAAGSQTQKQVPLLEGTYLVKFEDDTGNRSATPAAVITDLPTPQDRLLVEEHFEDTNYLVFIDDMGTWDSLGNIDTVTDAFPGTSTNMTYDSGLDALRLTDPTLLTGEYVFKDTVDLGGVFDVNLRRNLVTYGYLPNDLWDSQTSLIDTWTDIDGDSVDQVDALMYVRTTKDNPGGTPTWGTWNEMTNALIRGRGLQFKIIATTENVAQNIAISELGYVMEMQQRIERSALQNTPGTGAYTVTFAQPFYEEPAIGVTAYTQFASDLLEITEVTRTGFKLEFKQDGVTVSRSFTYTAVGYGKEIIV